MVQPDLRGWVQCPIFVLSVCSLVTSVYFGKTADSIEMPAFGMMSGVSQRNRVSGWRARWHHLANTVEWLCYECMGLPPGMATRPVPKLLWVILFLLGQLVYSAIPWLNVQYFQCYINVNAVAHLTYFMFVGSGARSTSTLRRRVSGLLVLTMRIVFLRPVYICSIFTVS